MCSSDLGEQRGYQTVETPILEQTELFARGVGDATDVVDKEMYTFEDRGGRSLSLRPEATASVVRAYFEGGLQQAPQPVRLSYWGPMFRYDRPQAGRYRQFYSFGVEAIGEGSPGLDVEVIELAGAWLARGGGKDDPALLQAYANLGEARGSTRDLRGGRRGGGGGARAGAGAGR